MTPSDITDDGRFAAAVRWLHNGDFSALDPLFADGLTSLIVRWHAAGRFDDEPAALAEAFTCACFNGRTAVAEYLLGHGVDPTAGAGTGLDGLHWAVNRGQLDTVRRLIERGVPLETVNRYGGTPLGTAVWSAVHESRPDHPAIIEALLRAGARFDAAGYPTGHELTDADLRRYRPPA